MLGASRNAVNTMIEMSTMPAPMSGSPCVCRSSQEAAANPPATRIICDTRQPRNSGARVSRHAINAPAPAAMMSTTTESIRGLSPPTR